eukprot:scaffold301976_cov21-Tisochrysis_lutea.AAC.1
MHRTPSTAKAWRVERAGKARRMQAGPSRGCRPSPGKTGEDAGKTEGDTDRNRHRQGKSRHRQDRSRHRQK